MHLTTFVSLFNTFKIRRMLSPQSAGGRSTYGRNPENVVVPGAVPAGAQIQAERIAPYGPPVGPSPLAPAFGANPPSLHRPVPPSAASAPNTPMMNTSLNIPRPGAASTDDADGNNDDRKLAPGEEPTTSRLPPSPVGEGERWYYHPDLSDPGVDVVRVRIERIRDNYGRAEYIVSSLDGRVRNEVVSREHLSKSDTSLE